MWQGNRTISLQNFIRIEIYSGIARSSLPRHGFLVLTLSGQWGPSHYRRGSHSIVKTKIHYTSFPVYSKSVTSWCGQKSVVSVVSCRFPNSITTTCCQLVAHLLAVSLTSLQQVGSFPVYGEVTEKRV